MKRKLTIKDTMSTYNFNESRGKILMPYMLKLAQQTARESIELGSDGGLHEVISVVYLKAAYGHLEVSTLEQMAGAFDLYGNS